MKEPRTGAATDPCYRLICRSHSLLPGGGKDEAALAAVLQQARAGNAERGIAGALLLYDDWFAQVLEGPQAAVEALYIKIKQDTWHDSIRLYWAGVAPSA